MRRRIIFLLGLIIFTIPHTYANLTLSSAMSNLHQTAKNKQVESDNVETAGKNIFKTTLSNYSAIEAKTMSSVLKILEENIKKTASDNNQKCTIKSTDILTILLGKESFVGEFFGASNLSLSQNLQFTGNTTDACIQYLNCTRPKGVRTINDPEREKCINDMYTDYQYFSQHLTNDEERPLINNNDNIYMDNNKDNAMYDLFVDMEKLEKALFDKNGESRPELPTLVYYNLPVMNIPLTQQSQSNSPTNNNSANNTIPKIEAQTSNPSGSTNTVGSSNGSNSLGVNNTSNTRDANINNIEKLNDELNSLLAEQEDLPSIESDPTSLGLKETTVSQLMCLPEDRDNPENSISFNTTTIFNDGEVATNDTIEAWEKAEQEVLDALGKFVNNPLNNNPTTSSVPGYSFLDAGGNQIGNVDQPSKLCQAECHKYGPDGAEADSIKKMTCEANCCMKSCNTIKNIGDKAACLSQCLCGEYSSQYDILRIRICRVQAKSAVVSAGKTVHSIEEVVDEMNQILLKLKQGGKLIKRTKTSEFLDTSFASIKLKNIMSFNIFVHSKPLFPTPNPQAKLTKAKEVAKKTQSLNNLNGILGRGADQNKYKVSNNTECNEGSIFDPILNRCTKIQENTEVLDTIVYNEGQIMRNNMIGNFLDGHLQYWMLIHEQIHKFHTITNSMRAKADAL